MRTQNEIREHYGCAMPQLNQGSEEYFWLAKKMSWLARQLNIPWAGNDGGRCPYFKERRELFARRIDRELPSNTPDQDNIFEGMTIALLQLFPTIGKVAEHTDKLNCPVYTETLLAGEIVHIDGAIYRVVVIAYMRKSCNDAMIRRNACREVAEGTKTYLANLPESQKPKRNASDHKDFYGDIGYFGLGLILKRQRDESMKICSIALLNSPQMDKPMGYLSPVTDLIRKVYTKHTCLTYEDLYAMVLPVGHLNGLFSYGSVLAKLADEERLEINPQHGLLGTIMIKTAELAGTYSGGMFGRSQVSWTDNLMESKRLKEDIATLKRICSNSTENPPVGVDRDGYCKAKSREYHSLIKKTIHGVGDLGAQHMMTVLAQLGLLKPIGIIHYAKFAVHTSTLKEGKKTKEAKNPGMLNYLNYGNAKSKGSVTSRSDRAVRVMESVVPHLQTEDGYEHITEAVVEQCNCERYREKAVVDFFFPGNSNYFLPSYHSNDAQMLWQLTPLVSEEGINDWLEVRQEAAPFVEPRKTDKICQMHGKFNLVREKEFIQCRVPREYIQHFPGLWEQIKSWFFHRKGHVPTMKNVCDRVEQHQVAMGLVRYFMSRKIPLTVGKRSQKNKAPGEVAQLILGQNIICKHPRLSPVQEECTTRKRSRDSWNDVTATVSSCGEASFDLDSLSTKSIDVNDIEIAIPIPDEISSYKETYVPCIVKQGFAYYQFPSQSMTHVTLKRGFGNITNTRKLAGQAKRELQLSPVYSEVKRSICFGINDRDMTVKMNKKLVVDIPCTTRRYEWTASVTSRTSSTILHQAQWTTNKDLQYFVIGKCCLVDTIAEYMGGIKGAVRDTPGLFHWLFLSFQEARKFLLCCLFVTAGKPSYYQYLFKKCWRLVQDDIGRKDSGTAVVKLLCEDKMAGKSGVMFYAVVVTKKEDDQLHQFWCLSPVPFSDTTGDNRSSKDTALILDPYTWKLTNAMLGEEQKLMPGMTGHSISRRQKKLLRLLHGCDVSQGRRNNSRVSGKPSDDCSLQSTHEI